MQTFPAPADRREDRPARPQQLSAPGVREQAGALRLALSAPPGPGQVRDAPGRSGRGPETSQALVPGPGPARGTPTPFIPVSPRRWVPAELSLGPALV